MLAGVDEILAFWFADAHDSPDALKTRSEVWFKGGRDFDHEVRSRFEPTLDLAATGACAHWEGDPPGLLALVLLFDQFPRNIHRGTGEAFAYDAEALRVAGTAVDAGLDRPLTLIQRTFLYMPFQHAEDPGAQARSVALYDALVDEAPAALADHLRGNRRYAGQHRDIVERFGRFPHRNRVLGRETTPDEAAWLEAGGPTFGQ